MTDLRTAAQQALEAYSGGPNWRGFADAMDALRAALAEPMQEPVAVVGGQRKGWFYLTGRPNVKTGDKLYTAPPQRKPLTEEEIETISSVIERSDFFDCVVPFARAVERAHGIGEPPCATQDCMPSRCPNCASLEAQNTELDQKLAAMERKLTDEVIAELWHKNGGFHHHFARAIERWLKGEQ